MSTNPTTQSALDKFIRYVLPCVLGISSAFQSQPALAKTLVALATVSFLASIVPFCRRKIGDLWQSRKETVAALSAHSELGRYVERFNGLIVNGNAAETLILSSVFHHNYSQMHALHVAPCEMLKEPLSLLMGRIRDLRPQRSIAPLQYAMLDFNLLVAEYCKYSACPIYENIPQMIPIEAKSSYTVQVHNELVQFRERLQAFLDSYEDFLSKTQKSLPQLNYGHYFRRPQPLQPFTSAAAAAAAAAASYEQSIG